MKTFFRFAGVATLLVGGLLITSEISLATASSDRITDFLSSAESQLGEFYNYQPSCQGKCDAPDSSTGSGTR